MTDEMHREPGSLPFAMRWDQARTERLLGRVHARIDRQRRLRRGILVGIPVAAVALLVVFGLRRGAPKDMAAAAKPFGGEVATRIVMLGDGSRVDLRDAATRLRVRQDTAPVVRVELQNGEGTFHVVRDPGRTFEVIAGSVTVAVVGTDFTVDLRGDRVWVEVQSGTVRVSWPDDNQHLSAGENGLFPPVPAAAGPTASAGPAAAVAAPAASSALAIYRSSIGRRDYGEAYSVLSRHPGLVGDSVDDLLTAADVARLSGHAAEAVPYLERVEAGHPHDGRAPLAAFTLGRTLLGLGRAREAGQTFARVRSRWPQSPLGEDALVRQIEAVARSGDLDGAQKLAQQYDQAYPQGRRRAEARRHAGLE
jgi:transmembrane sensor